MLGDLFFLNSLTYQATKLHEILVSWGTVEFHEQGSANSPSCRFCKSSTGESWLCLPNTVIFQTHMHNQNKGEMIDDKILEAIIMKAQCLLTAQINRTAPRQLTS